MEEALITLLAGNGTLTGLVGDRLSWGSREQGAALPAVTINAISGGPIYSDEGEVGLDDIRVQIDCWASTLTSAKAVGRAVRAVISGFHDATFRYVTLDAIRDMREGGTNQADYEYRVSMDFIILSGSA